MNINEILSGDTTDTSSLAPDITSSISDMLAPFMWLSVALGFAFIILYITMMLRRRKLENALLDMQKILHEMNERDKARSAPQVRPVSPETSDNKVIARENRP